MKIAILGASGFIGKNLVEDLKDKHEVFSISLRENNWAVTLEQNNFDIYLNLVGKAHDHKGTATEYDYFFSNFELLKELYIVFLESSAELFIHISSIAALEEFESEKPLEETDLPNPISIYGKSKRAAEEWLLNEAKNTDKKVVIIRPPMVHGPGDKGNLGLLYAFVSKGIPYPLSSFDNERSFISTDNFSFFIKEIIRKQDQLTSGIYHISDDEPLSTKEIIKLIKEVNDVKTPDFALPQFLIKGIAKVGDFIPIPLNTKRLRKLTSSLMVSNAKIKSELGINALPLSAKDGLKKTIESFKEKK